MLIGIMFFIIFQLFIVCLSFRPSIRFSSDEAVACRMATNEIQFFDTTDFPQGILYRLRVPGVAAFEVSKAPGSHVAVFVPESKVCPPCFQLRLGAPICLR